MAIVLSRLPMRDATDEASESSEQRNREEEAASPFEEKEAAGGEPEPERSPIALYVIVDDVGNNLSQLRDFLTVPVPLTFAVLPSRTYTDQAIELITAAGREAILHQPMEAIGESNPGAGAIYAHMSRAEIARTIDANLSSHPSIRLVNNHMGSRVTSDRDAMRRVMSVLLERTIGFLDSVTTDASVAEAAALEFGVRFGRRTGDFLDNHPDEASIRTALNLNLERARRDGHSVMIGHVQSDSLWQVLTEDADTIIESGYTFRLISEYPPFANP